MNKAIDVSIIILNYNTKNLLLACLRSIEKAEGKEDAWEIIVVDNASTDNSLEAVKASRLKMNVTPYGGHDVRFIQNQKNLGFAAGNNIGMRVAKGRYILLLNSDTEVSANAITDTKIFLDGHPDAGGATCKLVLPDGSMDPACHRGFPTPWAAFTYFAGLEKLFPHSKLFGGYHLGYRNPANPHEIDSPSGAFFMVRREVVERVGLLDEDYFMYGEDLDYSYRMKEAGFSIWYYPNASVLHRKKQSGRLVDDPHLRLRTDRYFYETMKIFYKKHFSGIYPFFYTWLINGLLSFKLSLLH